MYFVQLLKAMKHNINRVQKHLEVLVNVGEFLQSCFRWQSKLRTIVAFAVRCFTYLLMLCLFAYSDVLINGSADKNRKLDEIK